MAAVMEAVIRLLPFPPSCMRTVLCKPFYLATSFCGGAGVFGHDCRCVCARMCGLLKLIVFMSWTTCNIARSVLKVALYTSAIAIERICVHAHACVCACASTVLCKQAVKFNYLPPPLPRSVGVPAERGSASTEPFPWETLAHSG